MSAGFTRAMAIAMDRMMESMHAAGHGGSDPDTAFLTMMIPHHAGAIDMARLVLQHGNDPATRQLAQDIIASQSVEIEGMLRRLQALQRPGGVGNEFPALGGTRGP